jgi:hypothetical protein
MANNAYKQKMLNYLQDHEEDMTPEQTDAFIVHIDALNEVVYANEARALNKFAINKMETLGEAPTLNSNPAEGNQNEIPTEKEI